MDVRQQRSQARLFQAALRLAESAPAHALTVTEVAREAGVHRSTFYELASAPSELVEQALLGELDALRDGLLADDETDLDQAVTDVVRGVLEHVRRHAPIYRRGLADDSGAASLHPMLAGHFRETSRLLSRRARLRIGIDVEGADPGHVEDAAIRFIALGTVGALEAWLATDDLDVDGFLAVYLRLLPAWWPAGLTAG
ncbi:TetR/AcrR family transcriptional regulator [Nocardioides sp. C4-1]|uniref:TetR/AcrR family transcriptional regulator n=1 Tax=Nocardioides sp. C4-1 TaxID=3151851 RepID=UPI00326608D1